jgi:hypothetical protein
MSLRVALLVGVVSLPALAVKDPTFESLTKYRSYRYDCGLKAFLSDYKVTETVTCTPWGGSLFVQLSSPHAAA